MFWIFLFALLVWFLYKAFHNGNPEFWRIAAKYPDQVYELIKNKDHVWLVDPDFQPTSEWSGPFRLYVPTLDRVVKFYGKADVIEMEQRRILLLLQIESTKEVV